MRYSGKVSSACGIALKLVPRVVLWYGLFRVRYRGRIVPRVVLC